MNSRWNIDLNMKVKTLWLLEENRLSREWQIFFFNSTQNLVIKNKLINWTT